DEIRGKNEEEIIDYISQKIIDEYENKVKDIPEEIRNEFEKAIVLRVIDTHWMEHINTMSHLREGIHLRSYAQQNPLRAYTNEGFELFENLLRTIDREVTTYLLNAEIRQNIERKKVVENEITNESNDAIKKRPKKVQKVGRNEPCPCGSGKKYKHCCGR
ncbi:MAG: preprotein translocase subunit SecA, partial [Mollicutes bacterium]|nr:preprotein translocase subunit SecA [Mollicutes bacterium]